MAVSRDLKSSFKGHIDVDVNIDRYFGCLKGVSGSVQVLFHGIEAVMERALSVTSADVDALHPSPKFCAISSD